MVSLRIRSKFAVFVFGLLELQSAVAAGPAVSVGVAPVHSEVVSNKVTLIGSAVPRRVTRISAQVDGMVLSMAVDRGSRVTQGEELFHLDDTIARFESRQVHAQLAQARAEFDENQRKYKEAQRLREEGHVPQTTLETAGTNLAIAQAKRDAREAELARSKRIVEQHRVTAPFSGTVVTKNAEVGQWIRSDSEVLQLVETNPARVEVPVPEHLFTQIRPESTAAIEFESLPNRRFDAQVGALVPQGQGGARTFPVWLELANDEGVIAPGMSARVTLPMTQSTSSALFVPSDALVRRADGSTLVWTVKEDADVDGGLIAIAVRVQVGSSQGGRSQVEGQGLAMGDLVVVRGNESLRPNQRVRIVTNTAGAG